MLSLICIFTGIAIFSILIYLIGLEEDKPNSKWLLIGALICVLGSFCCTSSYIETLKTRALQFYEKGFNDGIQEYLKGNVNTSTTYFPCQ